MSFFFSPMTSETEVAVLFADVVGSTRLYEVLGDLKARDMVVSCVDLMRAATERAAMACAFSASRLAPPFSQVISRSQHAWSAPLPPVRFTSQSTPSGPGASRTTSADIRTSGTASFFSSRTTRSPSLSLSMWPVTTT